MMDKRKLDEHDFLRLVGRRWAVAGWLSFAMIAIYFGFTGLHAFNKPALAYMVAPGFSVAMLAGPAIIAVSLLLCVVYVRWTDRAYDPAVAELDR